MNEKEWEKNLDIKDMPNDTFEDIAILCGIETALKLLKEMSGNNIYVPRNGFKLAKDRYIRKHYDGSTDSIRRLARECGVSERYIYTVINETEGQIKLF